MAQGQLVKDHIRQAILDAAATLIVDRGDSAIMADVAEAAGIGRATLYRYFSTREDLLLALATAAIDDASARLVAADLENISVPEALARISRAVMASRVKFEVIRSGREYVDAADVERRISRPIRAVFQRGIEDGSLRSDLPVEVLTQLLRGLLQSSLRSLSFFDDSVERASAAVTEVLLHGIQSSS
jgi:AcrR family transcriptional regulator